MDLTKENVYVSLIGKSREELTDLYKFLVGSGEIVYRDKYRFLGYIDLYYQYILLNNNSWCGSNSINNKTEVTIDQLKQIIKPMETLQQQLQNAEAEVKRLKSLIEEENKIKIGDWALELHSNNIIKATEKSSILYLNSKEYCKKITNLELIKLLEKEIK